MKIRELIDYLNEQDPDADVELVIVAPQDPADPDDVIVDRYPVLGLLPWHDPEMDEDESVVWLISGEEGDFDDLLVALDDLLADGSDDADDI